jgi:triosephosphate isomerase
MRINIIAGNWKMFKSNAEAVELATNLKDLVKDMNKTKIILCPPATALNVVATVIENSKIQLGAQNLYWEKEGAFTGEISAEMIQSTGANYVLIGHSERRQYFAETNATVNKKLHRAMDAGLKPIVCIGETLEQREQGSTKDIVGTQIREALAHISTQQMLQIIFAYEPVWAIGTGKTASPDQAQEVHSFIRNLISDIYDRDMSSGVIIQYGGSVKPNNATDLLKQPDIDGALVGGACLQADSFFKIIQAAEKLM